MIMREKHLKNWMNISMIAKKDLKKIEETLGTDEVLDELVCELFAQKAEKINELGMEEQVSYLLLEGWFKGIDQLLDYLGCFKDDGPSVFEGKYVVIEKSGYVGEHIVKDFETSDQAYKWSRKQYDPSELESLHIQVAIVKDGLINYEI